MEVTRIPGILKPMTPKQEQAWLGVRKGGKNRFALTRGLFLGLCLVFSFTVFDCLVWPLVENRSVCTVSQILDYWPRGHYILLIICGVGGLIYGYADWYRREMQHIITVAHSKNNPVLR
jgi:hypothetical protein